MVQAPLRVGLDAHVVGRRQTGNETYILSLAEALAGRSDIDTVALLDAGTVWPFEEPPEIRYLRLRSPVLRIPLELPIAARRMRADLLHVQYVAPPVAGLPVVAAIHDLSFEDVPGLSRCPTELRLRLSVRATARRAAVIAAISSFTRDRIVELYGVSPERIVVTPVSVSPFWHSIDPIEQAATVAGLGLDVERPLVLAVVTCIRERTYRGSSGRSTKFAAMDSPTSSWSSSVNEAGTPRRWMPRSTPSRGVNGLHLPGSSTTTPCERCMAPPGSWPMSRCTRAWVCPSSKRSPVVLLLSRVPRPRSRRRPAMRQSSSIRPVTRPWQTVSGSGSRTSPSAPGFVLRDLGMPPLSIDNASPRRPSRPIDSHCRVAEMCRAGC